MPKRINKTWLAGGVAFVAACAICVVPIAGVLLAAGAVLTAGGGLVGSTILVAAGLALAIGSAAFIRRGRASKRTPFAPDDG